MDKVRTYKDTERFVWSLYFAKYRALKWFVGKALSLSLKHATAISKWRIHHCVLAACISTKIQTDRQYSIEDQKCWNQQVVRWNVSMRVHRLTQQILRVVSKYNLISELSKFQLHVNYVTKGEISFVHVWVGWRILPAVRRPISNIYLIF